MGESGGHVSCCYMKSATEENQTVSYLSDYYIESACHLYVLFLQGVGWVLLRSCGKMLQNTPLRESVADHSSCGLNACCGWIYLEEYSFQIALVWDRCKIFYA